MEDHPEDADAEELNTGDVLLTDEVDLEDVTPSARQKPFRNRAAPEPVDDEDEDSDDDDSGPLF